MTKPLVALFALLALVAFAVPLIYIDRTLAADWDYFNSLSWLVNTNIVHYGEWNVYDPWGCGGLDVWANPQQRMLSPLGLLDLTLPPHVANLAGLIIHAFFGLLGAFALLRHYEVRKPAAITLAFVFINGSWFGLHFAAGHIPYGGMQLLPWAGLAALHFDKPRTQLATALLFAFLLLDGAIYALIFSIYLMLTLWAVHRIVPKLTGYTVLLGAALLCTAALKMIPILAATGRAPIRSDASEMGWRLLLRAMFDPRQYAGEEYLFEHLRFHEFGCYLGVPLLLIIVAGYRYGKPFALAITVWLWAATAWLTPFNPWQIHRLLPFVNTAHVQSRVLIIVFLLLLVIAGKTLSQGKTRWWLLALLLVESIAVRVYTFQGNYNWYARPTLPSTPITKTTLRRTLVSEEKPRQYMLPDVGVHNCYEPSLKHEGRLAVAQTMADYRGEAWVFGPEVGPSQAAPGSAELIRYTPAHLTVRYDVDPPAIIMVNTRHNGGWVSGDAEVLSTRDELLSVRVTKPRGIVNLDYRPAYRPYQICAGVLAVLLFVYAVRIDRRRKHLDNTGA